MYLYNVRDNLRSMISNILNIGRIGNSGNYLGLPSLVGRNKKEILGFLKNKVLNKINSWNHRFLSRAGKEILIKSVIQALPSYAMSVFQIPKEIVKEIECTMNAFWWGAKIGSRKGIRWKSWSHLCTPKDWGGIGFRKLDLFNSALLCKQAWRLIQFPSSLVARVYQAKYYPNSSFLEARSSSNPSYIWNSLISTKEIIRKHSRWRIGNGNSVNIWRDRWLPDPINPLTTTPPFPFLENAPVSSLFNNQNQTWDVDIIQCIFNHRDATLITNIPLPMFNRDDKLIWMREDRGHFTVKSCYRALAGEHNTDNKKDWALLWKSNVPPKVKSFMWQACSSCLPTADLLRIKKVECNRLCPFCATNDESIIHLFAYCPTAIQCWNISNLQVVNAAANHIGDWFIANSNMMSKSQNSLFLMICWYIWFARNEKIWNNVTHTPGTIVERAKAHLAEWSEIQTKDDFNSLQPTTFITKWQKPNSGWFKLNVDAAVDVTNNCMGFGWVLRDDKGSFEAAASIPCAGIYSVKEAEAMAVREALSWLKDHHYHRCHIETDSLQVFQSLQLPQRESQFDLILLDVKDLLSSLNDVFISFAKRSANRIAHLLARESLSMSVRRVWSSTPPSFILNSLFSEAY